MISSDLLRKKILELPPPVLDYLYSESAGELNEQIISRNGLDEAQEEILFTLLREAFVKEVSLDRLIPEIKARFGFEDAKAKTLAADIAGYRLLPLDKWLADVGAYLRSIGADPQTYPDFRVPIEHRTFDQAAQEVAVAATSAEKPQAQARLRNVVGSFLAGVRTEAQTMEVLTRPEKIGGLGLDSKAAAHVVEEIHDETRSVVLDREAPPIVKPAPVVPKDDALTIRPEDAVELAQFKKPAKTDAPVDDLTKEIYLASGLTAADEAMEKRIKTVIGNRLRDVRDQMETLEVMTQPKELGGLGLSQDAARKLLGDIQARLRATQDMHTEKTLADKAAWVEAGQQQKVAGAAKEGTDQKAELERLYQSIVAKTKKATKNAPMTAPEPVVTAGAVKAGAVPPNLPVAVANPVPPEFRPVPKPLPLSSIPPASPLTIVRPTRESVAVPPPAPSGPLMQRPKLQDVQAAPKLTGPVEELRALTVVDFRRLSKDPKEACMKIKDKIDLVAEQSYTRRNEAIAAWSTSEVVRTYLDLMREVLNGTPLKDAAAAREAAKKPVLTTEEFQAVAELSRQLRY